MAVVYWAFPIKGGLTEGRGGDNEGNKDTVPLQNREGTDRTQENEMTRQTGRRSYSPEREREGEKEMWMWPK